MTNPLILKLEQRDRLTNEEKQVLDEAIARTSVYDRGNDMVREGERPTESKLLLSGFAGRYKIAGNGKRQISLIHVMGDFIDLQSFVIKKMDHSIMALSTCRVAHVPHENIRQISETYPHLTRLLWLHTALDGAMRRQWVVTMGWDALRQTAHLLCELFVRLQSIGQTEGKSFRFRLSQAELGETLGISTVHVNRMVQELRGQGLITWRGDHIVIDDWERLTQLAEFDPTYLSLENEPR